MGASFACPSCDTVLVHHGAVVAPFDVLPTTGDTTVCGTCWAVLELADYGWRMLTLSEFEAFETTDQIQVFAAAALIARATGVRPAIRFAYEPHDLKE